MILDKNLEFADAVSVGTPNSTTVNVGDDVDLTNIRDIGNGEPMYLTVQVDTAITSGGSATVAFQLASDAQSTLAVDGTQSQHGRSKDIAVALLVQGYEVSIPIPPGMSQGYERFLGFQVVETAGQVLTGGNVNAFISFHPTSYKSYPDANN